jgi:hypothetical protein
MSKYLKRVHDRRTGIIQWLKENEASEVLSDVNSMLDSLNRGELLEQFKAGIREGLDFCSTKPEINGLEYSWYCSRREVSEVMAGGYVSVKTEGNLDNSDLGPETIPGVEIEISYDYLAEEDFASIPADEAISQFIEKIRPSINMRSRDIKDLAISLVNLWNYELAIEALEAVSKNEKYNALRQRALWVTMAQHERPAVAIGNLFVK